MPEELGKIEKPSVGEYKKGRKLFFVPLIYPGIESPQEYQEKCNRYWEQVERQLLELELKLGTARRIFHELISESAEQGLKSLEHLNEKSYQAIKYRVDSGAELVATEEQETLIEFLDWSRCLSIGMQSRKVLSQVYQSYNEASKKRNDYVTQKINDTLKEEEIGILFMREGHQVKFPPDVEVFYIAPPALDEIKRWLREIESRPPQEEKPS